MLRVLLLVVLAASSCLAEAPIASAYRPMTRSERVDYYWKSSFASPGAAIGPLMRTTFRQANDDPPEWDQDLGGFGRRTGVYWGEVLVQKSAESLGAAAIGHDPRYIPKREGSVGSRIVHAFTSSVLTYDRSGDRVFAPARVGGFYAGSMARMAWMPDRYSWKDGLREGTQRIAVRSVVNLAREFWPALRDRMPGRKTKRPSSAPSPSEPRP